MAPGGDVMSLALAPSDVNVLYTLITTGNLRFFRSLDGGATWQPKALFPLESPFATKFAVNPANALTVYAYGSSGLQRSLDGGDSWTKIYPQSEIFTAVSSEILYTGSGVGSCGVDYEKNYFLARSDDGGETWLSSPLGCLDEIEQIAVLPSERDMIYLSVLKPGAPGGNLLKSIDGGLTWVTFTLPFDGAVSALLIDPNNSQILYASGVYGILKSMDGGETWKQISNKNMGIYHRLALSGGSLYAVEATTSKTPVYRSDDGGASWWVSMSLLPAGTARLIADPSQSGRLWAGLINYGIYLTENGGSAWVERNDGIQSPTSINTLAVSPSNPEVFYAAVEAPYPGVYKSVDGGQTWSEPLPGFVDLYPDAGQIFRPINSLTPQAASAWYPILEINKLLVHPTNPEIAWAATSRGIYETLDGHHWDFVLSNGTAIDLSVSAAAPDEPYAAMYDTQKNMYSVHRYCKTTLLCVWLSIRINSDQLTINVLRVDPFEPQHLITSGALYLADHSATGIFESLNGGSTWRQIGLIDDPGVLYDMAIAPNNPRIMLVSVSKIEPGGHYWTGRLFRSLDGGATWQDWSTGAILTFGFYWPVAMNELGGAYAGFFTGVYRRGFYEASWEESGLENELLIKTLLYNPGPATFLLAAGEGLYRLDLPPIQKLWLPILEI